MIVNMKLAKILKNLAKFKQGFISLFNFFKINVYIEFFSEY